MVIGAPSSAEAIGLCEMLTRESKLIGVSAKLRQVAVLRTEETCREGRDPQGGFGEVRKTTVAIHVYDRRGKRIKVIKLKGTARTTAPYIKSNGFTKLASAPTSPNKRCRVSGTGANSKRMRIRAGARTLFSKKMREDTVQFESTPYWFAAAKLLVLHTKRTDNPGHYAESSTSVMKLMPASTHGLRRCY